MPLLLRSIVVGVTVGVTLFELCKLLACAIQNQPSKAKIKCVEDDQEDEDQQPSPQEHYFCDATPAPRKPPSSSVQSQSQQSQGSGKSFGMEIECAPHGGSVQFTLLANDLQVDDESGTLPSTTTTRIPLEIQLDEDEQETHKDVLERIVADIDKLRSLQQQQQQQQQQGEGDSTTTNNTAVQIQLDADDASHQEFFQMLSEYVVLQQQELWDQANGNAAATNTTTSIRSASSESLSALSE